MAGTAILPGDQKIFSMKEFKEKGFSQLIIPWRRSRLFR